MENSMETTTTDPAERRRLQNRFAQRRFRQKRDQRRAEAEAKAAGHNPGKTASAPPLVVAAPGPSALAEIYDVDPELMLPVESRSAEAQNNGPYLPPSDIPEPTFGSMTTDDDFFSAESAALMLTSLSPRPSNGPSATVTSSTPEPPPARRSAQLTPTDPRANVLISPPTTSAKSDDGWLSALHIAAQAGHVTIVRVLLAQGIEPDEQDSDGKTPLMHAVIEGHEPAATALIEAGARLSATDRDGRSALHWAALHRREAMLEMLLKCWEERGGTSEVDIDAYDDSGFTPLHSAVHQGFEAGVVMLLRCGANVKFKARKCPHSGTVVPYWLGNVVPTSS